MAMTAAQKQDAYKFFIVSFGAITGVEYMNQINDAYNAGLTTKEIVNIYSTKPQFEAIYPRFLSNEQFADKLIENVVGASATAAAKTQAKADVVAAINAGWSKGDVVFQIFTNLSNKAADDADWGKTAAMLNNKVKVAEYYTETLLVNSLDLGALGSPLQSVTNDAASVEAAKGNGSLNNGKTFTLTTGVDNIVGTSGNDTITGVVDAAANGGTLTPGDVVDGGAGTDTANFVITAAGKWSAGATVKNVEVLNFRNVAGANDTLDVSNVTGATQLWSSGSTGAKVLTLNNVQSNATLGIANTTGADGLTVTFKDGTIGQGGTVGLAFNAAGNKTAAGVITRVVDTVGHAGAANAATDVTLALTATGANYAQFTDGANSIGGLKTITVGGAGSLDIVDTTTEFDNVVTVNASSNTGGFTIDLGANNKDVTFTGGSGNDTLTLPNFNATDSIDGGAGNDTLNVSLANVLAFTKAAPVKNVETLGITLGAQLTANQTVNGDFFGISNVTINDGPDLNTKVLSLSNLANGANVTFKTSSATTAGTISVDVKGAVAGTNESATLTFGKAVDFTTNAVTINAAGLETVTLATSTTSGGGAKLATLSDAALTTLKVTGSDGITVTTLNAAPVTTVDASGVVKDAAGAVGGVSISLASSTKAVTFTGGQGADTYTASGKGDTINGSLGIDTVNLGAGADKLVYTAANQSNAAGTDVINNFVVTADSIQFAASLQQGTASYIGAAAFTNTGATQLRMNGANLEVDLNGDTTADMVITLTGLTAADFGAANFSFA